MAKNIDPELKEIGEYLNLGEDAQFVVPEYQRPYSWQIVHCDKLWEDIQAFHGSESKDRYFFGTIIINCQDNDRALSLIDGQQRTTTFLLLLKALLLRINDALIDYPDDEESRRLYLALKDRRRNIMSILYGVEPEDVPEIPDVEKDSEICKNGRIMVNRSVGELYRNELMTILGLTNFKDIEENVVKLPRKQKDNKYTNFFRNLNSSTKKPPRINCPTRS